MEKDYGISQRTCFTKITTNVCQYDCSILAMSAAVTRFRKVIILKSVTNYVNALAHQWRLHRNEKSEIVLSSCDTIH